MKTVPTMKLTQEGCDLVIDAAVAKAKELKQVISICVVDAGGHLMAFKRMTNGRTHNTLISQAKARSAALTLRNSAVSGNSALGSGGGIYNAGTATLYDSAVTGNEIQAGLGGGIRNVGTLTLRDSTVSGNIPDDCVGC